MSIGAEPGHDAVRSEVEHWLDLYREARALHAALPEGLRDSLDAQHAGVATLLGHLAVLPDSTLAETEHVLLAVLDALDGAPVTRPDAHRWAHLRLIAQPGR